MSVDNVFNCKASSLLNFLILIFSFDEIAMFHMKNTRL